MQGARAGYQYGQLKGALQSLALLGGPHVTAQVWCSPHACSACLPCVHCAASVCLLMNSHIMAPQQTSCMHIVRSCIAGCCSSMEVQHPWAWLPAAVTPPLSPCRQTLPICLIYLLPPPYCHPLQAQQLLDQLSQVPTKRAAADICAALLQQPLEGDADALSRLTAAMQQLLSGEGRGCWQWVAASCTW
jgi:hypothetical protein